MHPFCRSLITRRPTLSSCKLTGLKRSRNLKTERNYRRQATWTSGRRPVNFLDPKDSGKHPNLPKRVSYKYLRSNNTQEHIMARLVHNWICNFMSNKRWADTVTFTWVLDWKPTNQHGAQWPMRTYNNKEMTSNSSLNQTLNNCLLHLLKYLLKDNRIRKKTVDWSNL